jgi:hypothetical protein
MGNMNDNSVEGITVAQLNLVYYKTTRNNGITLVAAETVLVLQGTHFVRICQKSYHGDKPELQTRIWRQL